MPLLCSHAASFFANRAGGFGCPLENLMKAPRGGLFDDFEDAHENLLFG